MVRTDLVRRKIRHVRDGREFADGYSSPAATGVRGCGFDFWWEALGQAHASRLRQPSVVFPLILQAMTLRYMSSGRFPLFQDVQYGELRP